MLGKTKEDAFRILGVRLRYSSLQGARTNRQSLKHKIHPNRNHGNGLKQPLTMQKILLAMNLNTLVSAYAVKTSMT